MRVRVPAKNEKRRVRGVASRRLRGGLTGGDRVAVRFWRRRDTSSPPTRGRARDPRPGRRARVAPEEAGISTAEVIKKLLLDADVGPRPGDFGGPLTEPVIVFRGEHARGFTLFNQSGQRVGSAVAVHPAASRARRPTHLELLGAHRDLGARCVLTVHDTGSRVSRLLRWREYEILDPDTAQGVIVRRRDRRAEDASISRDDACLGVIRPGNPAFLSRAVNRKEFRDVWPGFVVEADTGEQVARIRLARPSWRTPLVYMVVEVKDGASDELRRATLGSAVEAAFITAIAQARRSPRRSYDGRGGFGVEATLGLASQADIDF